MKNAGLVKSMWSVATGTSVAPAIHRSQSFSSQPSNLHAYVWGKELKPQSNGGWFADLFAKNTDAVSSPKELQGKDGWQHLSFGQGHVLHVSGKGEVYTYGEGKLNQLGLGKPVDFQPTLTQVQGLPKIQQTAVGKSHSIALSEKGEVFTWGFGGSSFQQGALGHGNKDTQTTPKQVKALEKQKVIQVAAGHHHSLALTADGQVYSWGNGENGVLGHGSSGNLAAPTPLEFFADKRVKQLSCGEEFSAAVTDDGSLFTWGKDDQQQLGLGPGMTLDMNSVVLAPCLVEQWELEHLDIENDTITVDPQKRPKIKSVACGSQHTLALTENGRVFFWGAKGEIIPQLVRGNASEFNTIKISAIAAGKKFSAVVDDQGCLYTWGDGRAGALGHGDLDTHSQPLLVKKFGVAAQRTRVRAIFAGAKQIGALTN